MTDEEVKKQYKEILANVPEEFRSALSYMAYERGHSAGEEEVISILRGLVDALKEPIANFKRNVEEEMWWDCC